MIAVRKTQPRKRSPQSRVQPTSTVTAVPVTRKRNTKFKAVHCCYCGTLPPRQLSLIPQHPNFTLERLRWRPTCTRVPGSFTWRGTPDPLLGLFAPVQWFQRVLTWIFTLGDRGNHKTSLEIVIGVAGRVLAGRTSTTRSKTCTKPVPLHAMGFETKNRMPSPSLSIAVISNRGFMHDCHELPPPRPRFILTPFLFTPPLMSHDACPESWPVPPFLAHSIPHCDRARHTPGVRHRIPLPPQAAPPNAGDRAEWLWHRIGHPIPCVVVFACTRVYRAALPASPTAVSARASTNAERRIAVVAYCHAG
jgi:hypothetical protein